MLATCRAAACGRNMLGERPSFAFSSGAPEQGTRYEEWRLLRSHRLVFLNKKDLFAEKIKTIDPKQWFPDYTGGCDYNKAERYKARARLGTRRPEDEMHIA